MRKRLKPPPLPPGSNEKIYLGLKSARTKSQYQKALCLWMRASLEMRSDQIAVALAMSPAGVRKIQARWLRLGNAVFKETGKGGPHNRCLSKKVERAFLDRLVRAAKSGSAVLTTRFVQEEFERRVGHPVSYPVIYRMLKRHGWRPAGDIALSVPQRWEAARLFSGDDSSANGEYGDYDESPDDFESSRLKSGELESGRLESGISDAELDTAMKNYDSPERPVGRGRKRWPRF